MFTRAFSQPICTPSRVQLLTGKHNYRNYESFGWLSPHEETFAEKLRAVGYKTAIGGKWQLSTPELDIEIDPALAGSNVTPDIMRDYYGFERYSLWQLNYNDNAGKGPRYWGAWHERDGVMTTLPQKDYGPDANTDYLIDFMTEAVSDEKPFLAYFPTTLPHTPWVPTP